MKWILQVVDQPRVGEKKKGSQRNTSQFFSFDFRLGQCGQDDQDEDPDKWA
jgi:hypothetical protein